MVSLAVTKFMYIQSVLLLVCGPKTTTVMGNLRIRYIPFHQSQSVSHKILHR